MERRRWDPWFAAAWILLVVVVTFGFWLQARTIHRIANDEQAIADLVTKTDAYQTRNAEELCGLLVVIDTDDRALIIRTFRQLGYRCTVNPGP
jgi:hypothetical protein